MNIHVSQFITLITVFILSVSPACSPAPAPASLITVPPTATVHPSTLASSSSTPAPPAVTAPPPTYTPLPTASPTPQRVIEQVTVPACIKRVTVDNQSFYKLSSSLQPLESFRYRLLYHYTLDDRYADDELSVEVSGAHSGRLASPVLGKIQEEIHYLVHNVMNFYQVFPSYERSQVVVTDLRSGRTAESIVTGNGFWAHGSDDPGWIAFDPATPDDMFNVAEIFSPLYPWMVYLQEKAPAMVQAEILNGREVLHRCWIPSIIDNVNNAVLFHEWENVESYLSNAELGSLPLECWLKKE